MAGCPGLSAQEVPPVQTYEPEVYAGGNQNWDLAAGPRGVIYVANNSGLLVYNGMQWTMYPSPNETIIRTVYVHEDLVYTGCYMDFGVWERDAYGTLNYRSLADTLQAEMVPDEHFWNIQEYNGQLLFQSLDQVFIYQPVTGRIRVFTPEAGIDKLFSTEAGIWYSDETRRLYALESGTAKVLTPSPLPSRIIQVWPTGQSLRILTDSDGLFEWTRSGGLTPLPTDPRLSGARLYNAERLADGTLALGSISQGLFLADPDGAVQLQVSRSNGLSNNTVLSLYEDAAQNLWVGTDNGLNSIHRGSPFRTFTDETGLLGTVYAAQQYRDRLYLGTNQGLFVRGDSPDEPFVLVPGTRGQVWSLFQHDGQLFCGHDQGTFLIEGQRATSLFGGTGTWRFVRVPNRPDLLIQGQYQGISVLQRLDGRWQYSHSIEGFALSSRYLAVQAGPELFISHEYKGIYGLRLDPDYRRVIDQRTYPEPSKGKHAGLTSFRGDILYYSRSGLYRLDSYVTGFRRDSVLEKGLIGEHYASGSWSIDQENDRLWCFTHDAIIYFSEDPLTGRLVRHTIPAPSVLLNAMLGYENISYLSKQQYLIGSADGYRLLELDELPRYQHSIYLHKATCSSIQNTPRQMPLDSVVQVAYRNNNLTFAFHVPVFSRFFVPEFQYRLVGHYNTWSAWQERPEVSFRNLPYGRYRLEVRSRLGSTTSENTLIYPFVIQPPWYLSRWAMAGYLVVISLGIFLVHRSYTRYYRRQKVIWREENQRRLETQQKESELEMVRLRNEQLQQDIDNKNRELAISTMSLVKKNELLHQIKDALKQEGTPEQNIRKVIRTINRNTDEEETWNFFKEAFENADQDFFKKIQEKHDNLTHNDLKLCAYLRLNLSSKEIAPLLNISVRSVEVKRYRLRKKMKLAHDTGLVEYILTI